jgi:hypothetical protein
VVRVIRGQNRPRIFSSIGIRCSEQCTLLRNPACSVQRESQSARVGVMNEAHHVGQRNRPTETSTAHQSSAQLLARRTSDITGDGRLVFHSSKCRKPSSRACHGSSACSGAQATIAQSPWVRLYRPFGAKANLVRAGKEVEPRNTRMTRKFRAWSFSCRSCLSWSKSTAHPFEHRSPLQRATHTASQSRLQRTTGIPISES